MAQTKLRLIYIDLLSYQLLINFLNYFQRQPSRSVLRKRCSENMQQFYKRTPIPKCDSNKVALHFIEVTLCHGCSPVNLLNIFRTLFPKYSSGGCFFTSTNCSANFSPLYFPLSNTLFSLTVVHNIEKVNPGPSEKVDHIFLLNRSLMLFLLSPAVCNR